jgi:TonB family protein
MNPAKPAFAVSVAIHLAVAVMLFTFVAETEALLHPSSADLPSVKEILRRHTRLIAPKPDSGGGGGGENDPLPPSRGRRPKFSPRPFVPPSPELRKAVLLIEPSIAVETPAIDLAQYGDPLATCLIRSGGPGKRGGIGSGSDGGIGPRVGSGVGDGPDGIGFTSQPLRGVTAPVPIYRIDPEYSEEARKAKHQGMVVLQAMIDRAGRVTGVRVVRSLGLGLDERAIEAVARWKFQPARKDGRTIEFPATIEVNFRLL